MNNIPFKNSAIARLTGMTTQPGLITRGRVKAAREMRSGVTPLQNPDGSVSTHVMSSGETGNKKYPYEVNPTVFPNDGGKTWTDLRDNPNAAYSEAKNRGEVIGFKSAKRAERFGYGVSWKQGDAKKEARQNYRADKKEGNLYTQSDQFKSDKKRVKGTNRQVTKTPEGRHVEVDKFNRLTGKGVSKEKDITFKSKGSPREKYVEKQVVKRDSDLNWKSEKTSRRLSSGGKRVRSESNFNTYDNP